MAFTVTPTSGGVPYLFEAEFANKTELDSGYYSVDLYRASSVGSCPPPLFTGDFQEGAVQALLDNGEWTQTTMSVPNGSCRVINLVIREVTTGNVIDSSFVTIDNV